MDNLRLFSTFSSSKTTFKKVPQKAKKLLPRDENGMITKSLDEKPHVSRQEILDKLNKRNAGEMKKVARPKGQKFGMEWIEEQGEPTIGDVKKNDPRDPMTTEKLKTVLSSGAISFSSKEQEVLKKILG